MFATTQRILSRCTKNNVLAPQRFFTFMRTDAPSDKSERKTVLFSVNDAVGSLKEVLDIFAKYHVNLTHIESRPNKEKKWAHKYDFAVDISPDSMHNNENIQQLLAHLQQKCDNVKLLGESDSSIPWFPRSIKDLDAFAGKTLEMGEELNADHPGFHDQEYRKRRQEITVLAKSYKYGEKLPHIEYTPEEVKTWGIIYSKLLEMYPTKACKELNYIFPLLEKNCGYGVNSIPQLQDISNFLRECTGFTLRPVTGLLTPRDFLNGLAFRVFHSTQYIRHHSRPLYTPEPDICHELMGHVPLFADPDFADFSQEIGLASLGASDEDIEKLATCYWFTVEFGLCKQNGELRAYGAGLLSSFGELEYSLSGKPQYRDFDPFEACTVKYPITDYQPLYFVASSFKDAKVKMRAFSESLQRPFSGIYYDPYTQKVDVLDSNSKFLKLANRVRTDLAVLSSALQNASRTENSHDDE